MELCRKQFFLHYNLLPYQYALMQEAHETGIPPMRHLMLEFPEDERCFGVEDEFMLGDALLVAPILEDYIESRTVYFPAGVWYDLFTGERFAGGRTYEIALCKEHCPVFMRAGGAVTLNVKGGALCTDVGNRLDGYEELTFLICGEGTYSFRDDLGNHIEIEWTDQKTQVKRNDLGTPVHFLRLAGREE